jgi:hypothetical protein
VIALAITAWLRKSANICAVFIDLGSCREFRAKNVVTRVSKVGLSIRRQRSVAAQTMKTRRCNLLIFRTDPAMLGSVPKPLEYDSRYLESLVTGITLEFNGRS